MLSPYVSLVPQLHEAQALTGCRMGGSREF